jgi:co-chaperonin GroES (HSP10)
MKTIQAINDKVVAEVVSSEDMETAGGIIIPSNVKMEPQKYGKVTSVGEEVTNIKVGDIIVFHLAGGQVILLNGTEYRILMNNEIYGILKD